jgi:hypothetical protein
MKKTRTYLALRRHKVSLLADQRGAVAFEMLIVYAFLMFSLFLPAADIAAAGFQFIAAWEALRGFGEYVQYNPPSDPTSLSAWASGLQTTVAGYTIGNIKVLCGDTALGVACTSANITSPNKYYSYTTTVTLTPMVLTSALCVSGNANKCSFTLSYSERYQ